MQILTETPRATSHLAVARRPRLDTGEPDTRASLEPGPARPQLSVARREVLSKRAERQTSLQRSLQQALATPHHITSLSPSIPADLFQMADIIHSRTSRPPPPHRQLLFSMRPVTKRRGESLPFSNTPRATSALRKSTADVARHKKPIASAEWSRKSLENALLIDRCLRPRAC